MKADVGDGRREYIRIDNDREQMMRCEAEGVTVGGVSGDHKRGEVDEHESVDITSPS